jgi:hypothetical protein
VSRGIFKDVSPVRQFDDLDACAPAIRKPRTDPAPWINRTVRDSSLQPADRLGLHKA